MEEQRRGEEERARGGGKGRKRNSRSQKLQPHFSSIQVMKGEDCNQKKKKNEELPWGPVVKTPSFHCERHGFPGQ